MTRRLVLLGATVALALTSLPAVASATFIPGPNGKVVWTSGRANSDEKTPPSGSDNSARLWVADWPSGTPVQVTTGPVGTQHRHPSWSPDHTRIVYAAGPPFSGTGSYELRIKDLRTGTDAQFAPAVAAQDRPSWSPDGTRIAYGSNGELWVKGVAPGSEPVQITDTAGIQEERAVWSPDGNTLYYNRGVPPFNAGTKRDLYRKSPVTLAGAETPVITTEEDEWQPALSPDGKQLCFTRGPMNNTADVYLVPAEELGLAPPFATSPSGNINCVWSPDGSTILFTLGVFENGNLFAQKVNGASASLPDSWSVDAVGNKHFDGNADWATNFPPACDPVTATIGANQFTTIQLSCTDPDFGFGGSPPGPLQLEANDLEILSPPGNGAIGGLSDDARLVYTPNKDFVGTDTFTYTGSDGTSEADPATVTIRVQGGATIAADRTRPAISNIRVSAKRWRLGNQLAKISAAPVGTTISFRLSEPAQATLTFQRRVRRKGKTKFVGAGKRTFAARAGNNRVRFQGLITRSKKLSLGTHRVVVAARDAAGNRSKRNGPTFTIVKK